MCLRTAAAAATALYTFWGGSLVSSISGVSSVSSVSSVSGASSVSSVSSSVYGVSSVSTVSSASRVSGAYVGHGRLVIRPVTGVLTNCHCRPPRRYLFFCGGSLHPLPPPTSGSPFSVSCCWSFPLSDPSSFPSYSLPSCSHSIFTVSSSPGRFSSSMPSSGVSLGSDCGGFER